jgi:hypothetical protein
VIAISGWPLAMLFHAAARDLQGERLHNALVPDRAIGVRAVVFTAIARADLASARLAPCS